MTLPKGQPTMTGADVPHLQRPVIGATDHLLIVHLQTPDRVVVSNHGHSARNAGPAALHRQIPHLNSNKFKYIIRI